ncbi:hypothetical protein HBI56_105990 [Parastagonospora nodorum]|nr:hypothetical protein HBH51_068020 [Parastagonospora nodorum]KAH3995878.1 hypothetical protein HBI10_164830 [Parastagonospora nodorum]KAH4021679.1 hypothetical protein HBI13_106080 [Parastagonospora nodorum]KAH4030427.1 hypothetical protein HBI09_129550 [Parastagonospora nodorum]KAH4048328.1 hypothetical protein HBH49_156810 [Parastagonospora nodorum]
MNMLSTSCNCLGRASNEMEAPIPVQHAGNFEVEKIQPKGLKRKSSKLQTHVEVLRCRLGKSAVTTEAGRTFEPSKDWTPIYYAVYHRREAALTHFLRNGGSPDDVTGSGQPPLCVAVVNGHIDVVRILLEYGANVDATTRDSGETALHLAIKNNHTEIIDLLLEAGPQLEAHTTETNETPLHYAASKSGSLATIVALLKLGAKYDTKNSKDQSPAESALLANNIQGAVAIINAAHGRRHRLVKEKEMLLKHVERSQNRFSIGNELIADIFSAACDPDSTVLVESIKRDDASLVEMFLSKGADPDRVTARGERPIFIALECAGAPVVQALVKHNADVQVRDATGLSVLQAAFEGSMAQDKDSICAIFECLLSKGANAMDTYIDGKNLLHRAVSPGFGYAKAAHLFLKSGIKVNSQDGDGNTALHLATHSKSCMELLLKNRANSHIVNREGLTPLLHAIGQARKGDEPDLEVLIKASSMHKLDSKGRSALHLAASNGLEKNVRALLRARADTSTVDSEKHTSLLLAAKNHQWHIVPTLTIPPSINSWDEQGMTALHHIASSSPRLPSTWKDVAAAAVPFCERGVSRSMRDRSGATPLIVAIKTLPEDGLPIIETLLMKSADERASWNCIGHEDHDRRDALYYAITMRRPLFVDVLLKNGAAVSFMDWVPIRGALNLSVDTDKQISSLIAQHEWSRRAGILRTQQVVPEQKNQRSLFTEMFPTKDLAIMILMGLDPNALPKSSLGSSMLWAVLRQVPLQPSLPPAYLFDTIKLVLEHSADPNAGTTRAGRRTPSPQSSSQDLPLSMHTLTFLMEECPTVDAELITLLLNKGTELSLASSFYDGRYPLHSAAKANRIDLVDKFLLQRADVDCADLEDRTPLFIAAKQGFWEIVNAILSRHANVNLQDKDGDTVLHMAACGGSKTVVAALLRAGAKANVKNTKNQTPLACVSENLQVKEKEKDKIVYMLKDAEQKEKVVEEQTRKMNAQSAAQEAKMKQQREQDEKNKQQRQQEEQERKVKESEVSVQELSQVEAPPQVSQPTLKKRPSMLSKFRSSTFLAGRSKPQSPSPPVPVGMPKLEVSIRITTPPASKHLDIASQNPAALITTPSIVTAPHPPADTSKRAPNFRIDSGSWQKRVSDAEQPLPVLDRTKAVLNGKTGDKRNSSAAELADWLALSKMMDGL